MSSDDHPGALTPDMLQTHVRLVDVADLEDWSGPYQGDIGAAHTHLGAFGQLQLPVVSGGAVVYGQEFVAAERVDGQYGGRMAVLDLTDLDWPREKIIAAVLGLDRLKALQAVDAEQLLGLLQEVRKADEAWLTGAGYDPDDLDAIYEQLQRDQEALNVPDFEPTDEGGQPRLDQLSPDEVTCPQCGHSWDRRKENADD